MSYVIESADPALFAHGYTLGVITDALTGRQTAVYRGGARFVLDEPLCEGCDEPADRCDCHALAPVERLSPTSICVAPDWPAPLTAGLCKGAVA